MGEIQKGDGELEEDWRRMKEKVTEIIERGEEEGRVWKGREGMWFEEECRNEKRKLRKELRRWRREEGEGENYRVMKRNYEKVCQSKRKMRDR